MIQQQRGRQAECTETLNGQHLPIEIDLEVLNADLTIEVAYHVQSALVERELHHLEVWATELRLQPIPGRHFLPTRHAPSDPEVQYHYFFPKVGQASRLPLAIEEADYSHRL